MLASSPDADFKARWWSPWSWWRAGRRARKCDVLLQPWVTPFHVLAVVVSAWAARPVPTILLVHNVETHEWFPMRRVLTRWAIGSSAAVVVHSDEVRNQVLHLVPQADVRSVPMPSVLVGTPAELPGQPPLRILMIGYVRPYKGLELALKAIKLLHQRGVGVRLTVVGEFWSPTHQEATVLRDQLGLESLVDLEDGYISDEDLITAIANHHVVLLPYLSASQSAITPVAHGCHRPVVASDLPGLAEQIRDGSDGVLFQPGSAPSLADAIEHVDGHLHDLVRGAAARPQPIDALSGVVEALARQFNASPPGQ